MYKITLMDYNCSPIADGVICFFTDDIDSFEKHWFELDNDANRRERYLRSKAGELVSDYWATYPEINIFQEDKEAEVFHEQQFTLNDVTFEAANAYGYKSKFHIDEWDCIFRWIRFKKDYIRIVRYKATGVCTWDHFADDKLTAVSCYGNPVLLNIRNYSPWYNGQVPKEEWPEPTFDDFSENSIETICWLTNGYFNTRKALEINYRNFQVTNKIMDRMFADVVGEAG